MIKASIVKFIFVWLNSNHFGNSFLHNYLLRSKCANIDKPNFAPYQQISKVPEKCQIKLCDFFQMFWPSHNI